LSTSGYTEDVTTDPAARTSLDNGPPVYRQRFTAVPRIINGIIDTLSSTDVENLKVFFETTCLWGSLPFVWKHPRTGATATFQWAKYPTISSAGSSPIIFQAVINLILMPT
jgi:hypothetical protein